jgi:hypothetical protein
VKDRPAFELLLAAERARPKAPAAEKDAARARLAALLGPSVRLGEARPNGSHPSGSASGPNAERSATGAVTRGAGIAKLVLAFGLGSAVTAGILTMGRPSDQAPKRELDPRIQSSASIEVSSKPIPSSSPLPLAASGSPPPLISPSAPLPLVVPVAPGPSATALHGDAASHEEGSGRGLAGERLLLERARSALARGDGEQALAAVDQHSRTYPRGQLAEEREVLGIQALVAAGRRQEAAERAGSFRLTYKNSVLLPVVDEALR